MLTQMRIDLRMTLQPMFIPVYRHQKKTGKAIGASASVLCMHEAVPELEAAGKFFEIFGEPHQWERFWYLMRNQTWLREHPLKGIIESEPHLCAPYVLHADDAPVSRRVGRSIRSVNMWGPLGKAMESMKGVIPMGVTVNDEVFSKLIEERVDKTIAWSARAAAHNVNPSDAPFEECRLDKRRQAKAGTACSAHGHRLVFCATTGDWPILALEFQLPFHYNCDHICMMDLACKVGSCNFADFRWQSEWALTERKMAEFIASLPNGEEDLHQLGRIPGWHTHSFMEDQLHCDALGPRQHLCGTMLRDLSYEGAFGAFDTRRGGGSWHEKLDKCLLQASVEFQADLAQEGKTCSQQTFTTLKLSMHRQDDFPVLKAKGHNCITISKWLMKKVKGLPMNEVNCHRFACLRGFVGLWDVVHDMRPRFELTEVEKDVLCKFRESALGSYLWLHERSVLAHRRGFNMIPKLHQMDHMVRRSVVTGVAFHTWWCFKAEDLMGRLAKISANTHGATTMKRVIQRWLVQWWLWIKEVKTGHPSEFDLFDENDEEFDQE